MTGKKKLFQIVPVLFAALMLLAGCAAADEKTDLRPAPGTYEPAFFSFSGGSGRVTITCPEVTVGAESGKNQEGKTEGPEGTETETTEAAEAEDPETNAVLVFSSPHYEWVKVNGVEYLPDNAETPARETSVFTIPVLLDEEMKISALTTAMSEPHEIEYTIFISLDPEKAESGRAAADSADAETEKASTET
ncbi:MAG: hypothetical protein Q4D81_12495, partial [Eubacteriales bacterium]|nr:hypothetical protein [Eubacteriales bacterium]